MKLKSIRIKNFKSLKEICFDFPESGILVLVGENNSGKSNIIRAIDAICGESWYGKDKMEDHDFYLRTKENNIEIDLNFSNGHLVEFRQPAPRWGLEYYTSSDKRYGSRSQISIKEAYPCTYLGADRTFDKHLAFYDWTLIGRIRKNFHNQVSKVDGLNDNIKAKFEELVELFDHVPGFIEFKKDFVENFKKLFPTTSTSIGIDFKPYTPANLFKTMQILALDKDQSEQPIDLGELGEGAKNLILIALLKSFAKNFKNNGNEVSGLLALEEPELYLHPQAQRHLAKVLKELASTGYQVIISTHSAAFLDTEFFDSIGRVIKIDDPANKPAKHTSLITCSVTRLIDHCRKTGVQKEKVTPDSIREFYKTTSNPRLNEGFFARLLILVEGETEELTLPIYLNRLGIDCDALGISIVPVNGKSQIPKYWRLYSQFEIPIIVAFDNDGTSTDAKKANGLLASCFQLDADSISDVKIAKTIKSITGVPILIFNGDYEKSLKEEIGEELYVRLENEAKDVIKPLKNSQKGVISRFIANRLVQEMPDFNPHHARLLQKSINELLGLSRTHSLDEKTGESALSWEELLA